MTKANAAVAIIAKDASQSIGACLDSIVPFVKQVVVCVDERTTDATAAIALKHGAKVVTGLKVSDWHECPRHGKVLIQDFAAARKASFAELRRDVDWHGWIDSDDVVKGGEKLAECLGSFGDDVDCLWLPYHYATVGEEKQTSTLFDRERFVRANKPWRWMHRVHEVLVPVDKPMEEMGMKRTDAISIWHQGAGHSSQSSARRNILCLEVELEDHPGDQRVLFYQGNQYFALEDYATAADYYEAATHNNNRYQLWQTLIYLSMAQEKLGDLDRARASALRAADVVPFHPEPYYRLAALYMLMGDEHRCEFWTSVGDNLPDPPFFAFRNPLDRTYNARVTLGQALARVGRISAARRQLEAASKVIAHPEVTRGLEYLTKMEGLTQDAEALVRVFKGADEERRLALWQALDLSPDLRAFGRVRDLVVPTLLRQRPSTQPRMIFWCGQSAEPWYPGSISTTGIGGSETAVIQIARRFASDGWRVDVYNDCDKYEGVHDGVGYWDCKRLTQFDGTDVLVSWRHPEVYKLPALPMFRKVQLLWCHDLHSGPDAGPLMRHWNRVLGVSDWHARYLAQAYGLPHTDYVPNGVDLDRFDLSTRKVPFRCCYTSSPDRGLDRLLLMWPEIAANEPAAELHVAYGWDTIDRYIQMGRRDLIPFKARLLQQLEASKQVVWRGRLNQNDLAQLFCESALWLFPTSFTEVSCITAMEAMAGRCLPVTSAVGALPSTIGDGGMLVQGNTYTPAWREWYTAVAKGALHLPEERLGRYAAMKARAEAQTWDASYERWKGIIASLLERKEERELATVV